MTKAPPAPPPIPKTAAPLRSPKATIPDAVPLSLTSGVIQGGDRIGIYGPSGVGKSTAAAWLPAPVFLDLERSTKKIAATRDLVHTWTELRGKVRTFGENLPDGARSLVVDTATVAEELAKEHVIDTRLTEKGKRVDSIEGFGYNKGWQFVYDEFVALLADLDRVADQGLNVCLIMHDIAAEVPNPDGEDYLAWRPLLYAGDKRGKANIVKLTTNWLEHLVFVSYDVNVTDNKASGAGTRTAYTLQLPTHVAKSRTKQFVQPFTLDAPGAMWSELSII